MEEEATWQMLRLGKWWTQGIEPTELTLEPCFYLCSCVLVLMVCVTIYFTERWNGTSGLKCSFLWSCKQKRYCSPFVIRTPILILNYYRSDIVIWSKGSRCYRYKLLIESIFKTNCFTHRCFIFDLICYEQKLHCEKRFFPNRPAHAWRHPLNVKRPLLNYIKQD